MIHINFLWSVLTWAFLLPVIGQIPIAHDDILPPNLPWSGPSLSLAVAKEDPWATDFERSGMMDSPDYAASVAWLRRLVDAAPELEMVSIGRSLEGREIYMVIASSDRAFSPGLMRAGGKPLLLVHGGIHAGEIDGKDAGMMLLRDLTVRGTHHALLEKTNLLYIPILNADGHERASAYNRINQRGPSIMGWRTNGRNLNLNRDFTKLETQGTRAVVDVINAWQPDLYLDIHVTDGVDYQYDITFGFTAEQGFSPAGSGWMERVLKPALIRELKAQGHIPGPLIFAKDNTDLTQGIYEWVADPRFSNGYGDLRHLPTVLIENHSLKPYHQRVLGTYVLVAGAMSVLGEDFTQLRAATEMDRSRRPESVPLGWALSSDPPQSFAFLGIRREMVNSDISGMAYPRWLGQPETIQVPFLRLNQPSISVARPKGYWVPPTWPEIIEKLEAHGIYVDRLSASIEREVEIYRLQEVAVGRPSEGRVMVSAKTVSEKRRMILAPGSAWVTTDQPLGDLAIWLLEPSATGSFFQMGYFLEALERTEYFEVYAVEPLARKMLESDPELKSRFEKKLAEDGDFAKSPFAILNWFYSQSPYADSHFQVYPVTRVP